VVLRRTVHAQLARDSWYHRGVSRTRRRALLAAFAWLVGVEVLPDIHLALHDELAPHVHDGDRVVYLDADHDDGGDDHEDSVGTHVEGALQHGAHSLAHHAVAVRPTLPSLVVPLPVDRRPTRVAIAIARDLTSIAATLPRARGPPALASA
jgi:hypothetical protein